MDMIEFSAVQKLEQRLYMETELQFEVIQIGQTLRLKYEGVVVHLLPAGALEPDYELASALPKHLHANDKFLDERLEIMRAAIANATSGRIKRCLRACLIQLDDYTKEKVVPDWNGIDLRLMRMVFELEEFTLFKLYQLLKKNPSLRDHSAVPNAPDPSRNLLRFPLAEE